MFMCVLMASLTCMLVFMVAPSGSCVSGIQNTRIPIFAAVFVLVCILMFMFVLISVCV